MKTDADHNPEVALQGNLAIIELNTIFQFFDYSSASGELRIIGDDNNASFFFRKGMLIFGALGVNQKKIGSLLLDSRLITPEQLAHCLDIHARHEGNRRLGEILVGRGFIDFESLATMLKKQAREAFFATLSWKKGWFYFYADQFPAEEEILLNDRIERLLLEGFVRMDNATVNASPAKS